MEYSAENMKKLKEDFENKPVILGDDNLSYLLVRQEGGKQKRIPCVYVSDASHGYRFVKRQESKLFQRYNEKLGILEPETFEYVSDEYFGYRVVQRQKNAPFQLYIAKNGKFVGNFEYLTTMQNGPAVAKKIGEDDYFFIDENGESSKYYPYAEGMTANNIPVVVATNQDTEGYIKNDYLYSKLSASAGQTDVKLTFDHALSLVEVTLAGSGAAEGAIVDLLNVATDARIDLTAETPVTTGSTTATVTMDALSSLKYRAIVPAQKIAASTPVFKIAVNGRTYQAKYSGEINFEQGKYLAMTVTLGEQGGDAEIEITASASINNWTEGTSNGDASISVAELNIPLPTDGKVLETIASNWSALTASQQIGADKPEGWYKRSNSAIVVSEVGYDDSEQALTIKRTSEGTGGWNNDQIVFHSKAPFERAKYTLSFDVMNKDADKVSPNDSTGVVGITVSSSNDNRLFMMYNNSWSDWKRDITTFNKIASGWVSKSVNLSFEKLSSNGSSNIKDEDYPNYPTDFYEDAVDTDVNGGVNIIFYNNSAKGTNTTLYIRNIKLTKVE